MTLSLLFSLMLGLSSFASAQDHSLVEVSLQNIFEELKISSEGPTKGMYPVDSFASSPDGQTISLGFHAAEVPKGSGLDNQRVLIKIKDGQAQILSILNPFNGSETPRLGDVVFINDQLLRLEVLKPLEGPQSYERDYLFYDLKTKSYLKTLSSTLPLSEIQMITSIDLNTYLVYHVQGGIHMVSVVWMNVETQTMIRKFNIDPKKFGEPLLLTQNLVDERDIRVSSNGEIWIHYSYHSDSWKKAMLKVTSTGEIFYSLLNEKDSRLFEARVDGFAELIGVADKSKISVYNAVTNALVKEWSLPLEIEYDGSLTRVPNGYIFQHTNHPYYGYIFLKDDGNSEELTSSQFRLIHSSIKNNLITGLGNVKPDGSVNYYIRRIQADSVGQAVGQTVGQSTEKKITPSVNIYPEIAKFRRGRYRIVRFDEQNLAVIDTTYIDDILRLLPLVDKDFQVIAHQNSIEIIYPTVKAREAYNFPTFRKVIDEKPQSMDCEDALN